MKFNLIVLLIILSSIHAATFNVSSTPELRQALSDAAQNGQDDTIILADGTYKTADDSQGTFFFLDSESYSLTIKGSNLNNVSISGSNQSQILNLKSIGNSSFYIQDILFIDGNNTNSFGGAIYSKNNLQVDDCNFTNNTSESAGGAICIESVATINNSYFIQNFSGWQGGAVIAGSYNDKFDINISNSIFINNVASNSNNSGGGAISGNNISIKESLFEGNKAIGGGSTRTWGGAIVASSVFVEDSNFTNNFSGTGSNADGGAIATTTASLYNSIFVDNNTSAKYNITGSVIFRAGTISNCIFKRNTSILYGVESEIYGAVQVFAENMDIYNTIFEGNSVAVTYSKYDVNDAYRSKVVNSIFIKNRIAIHYSNTITALIANSIFKDNELFNINGGSNVITYMHNNYIDKSKNNVSSFDYNNVFNGITLGFIDEANKDYRLTDSSDLIDEGTVSLEEVIFPTIDLDGDKRISCSKIDIGPYEYQKNCFHPSIIMYILD